MRNEVRSVGSDMFEIRIVDDYAGGIPKSVAHLHEQYYTDHYCTIFNSQTAKHGLNMNSAPRSAELDTTLAIYEPATDLSRALGREAALRDVVEIVGEENKGLSRRYEEARMVVRRLEHVELSALAVAEKLAAQYEAMPPFDDLNRAVFMSDLNSIRDKLNSFQTPDTEMLAAVKGMAVFCGSDVQGVRQDDAHCSRRLLRVRRRLHAGGRRRGEGGVVQGEGGREQAGVPRGGQEAHRRAQLPRQRGEEEGEARGGGWWGGGERRGGERGRGSIRLQ